MSIGLSGIINQKIEAVIEGLSIDEVLRGLIADSDLEEVVCCLDMIAREDNEKNIELWDDGSRLYPSL